MNFTSWKKRGLLQGGIVFAGLVFYFGFIQGVPQRLSGNDSYFHIKYAWLIWHEGAVWDFPWLQGTLFRNVWVDHSFLFHLLLIPFTWLGDLYLAAKAAAIFWSAAAFFSVYFVIRSMDAPDSAWRRFAWIWPMVLLAGSHSMLYRLSQTRVQAVSVIFMMAAVVMMEKERYRLLLPLGFCYAWLYHGSLILIPLTLLYGLSCLVVEKRWVWQPVAWATAGLCLGFVLNPYFPHSLDFLIRHVYEFAGNQTGLPLAAEWQDYSSWFLFQSTQGTWLVLLLGVLILGFSQQRITKRTLFWLLANAMMLVLLFKARRFVEYWPLFAVLFMASAFCDAGVSRAPLFSKPWQIARWSIAPLNQKAICAGIVAALCIAAGANAVKTINEIYLNAPPDRFSSAVQWLKANTPKNAVVFNNQWDTFPDLFFHDHHNLWVAGLNPNFTYFLEPRLWLLYRNVTDGDVMDTARYLQRDFGASYALTLKKEGGLTKLASIADNGLNPVWEDGQTVIYEVRPSNRLVQMEAELYPYQMKDTDVSVTCKAIEQSECRDDGNPSARAFLQCGTRGRFAKISWTVDIPKAGTWTLAGRFLKTPTGGTAEVLINGKPLGAPVDLNGARRQVGEMQALGSRSLTAGSASVEIAYRLPAGGEQAFGLDVLRFIRSE